MTSRRSWLFYCLYLLVLIAPIHAALVAASESPDVKARQGAPKEKGEPKPTWLAKVGPDEISLESYFLRLETAMREKFFHGKIPEKELKEFRKQVAEKMIDDTLYLQEAKRRGISPDKSFVDNKLDQLNRKKKKDQYWQEHKDQFIKAARKEYQEESMLQQLERAVKDASVPTPAQVQKYYGDNSEKFTAPERVKVHMILLKVDPSSTNEQWDKAAKLANEIVSKIKKGERFEELARIHSGDESAASGGDMGYQHKGMLGGDAAKIIESMKPGDLSEPIFLLEGIAIIRLDDREKPRLNEFERVDDSAKELLRKEQAENAWKDLVNTLRKKSSITVNDAVF